MCTTHLRLTTLKSEIEDRLGHDYAAAFSHTAQAPFRDASLVYSFAANFSAEQYRLNNPDAEAVLLDTQGMMRWADALKVARVGFTCGLVLVDNRPMLDAALPLA